MKLFLLITFALYSRCYPALTDREFSISELPKHIKPRESALSLIADFEHPIHGKIVVYLVNRTGKDIQLRSDDSDTFLKLEYRDPDGKWRRAEPHVYSWCGTHSSDPPTIRNDRGIFFIGYQPSQGQPATIRFRLYQEKFDLASNVGQGLVFREDIQQAQCDAMAVVTGDFAVVASIARGTNGTYKKLGLDGDPRALAISHLWRGRFDRKKSEQVLRRILASKDEDYRERAQRALDELKHQAKHSH